jgi:hypothetical protein
MKTIIASFLLVSALVLTVPPGPAALLSYYGIAPAYAEEEWKKEFEAICSKTDEAMNVSKEELQRLVARCDSLKPVIEKLDESTRKVYLRRLQSCRDLLAFVLASKEKN